jgi:DNA-binding NarL/FixJ family response regulator
MITVAVVEDDARIRRTVEEVLAKAKDCCCVAAFAQGITASEQLPTLAPDVILMDINLPDISGVECVTRISPQLPQSEIIMLTVFQDPESIFRALAAGAHGYLVKPVMPSKLLEAIREIRNGGVPMSPSIARNVIDYFRHVAPTPAAAPLPVSTNVPTTEASDNMLGPRERQVVEALVEGYSYKEIAGKLDISIWTVATYVRRIYEKLHVCSRREIIAKVSVNK